MQTSLPVKHDTLDYKITRLTPGVLLPPDHRHEFKILIPITLLDMTTITVIDHGMSLSVLYDLTH